MHLPVAPSTARVEVSLMMRQMIWWLLRGGSIKCDALPEALSIE